MNVGEHNLNGPHREDGKPRRQPQTTATTKSGVKVISWTAPEGEEFVINLNHLDELGKACIQVAKDPEQLELSFDEDNKPKAAKKRTPRS